MGTQGGGSISIWHWIVVIGYFVLLVVPAVRIVRRAGMPGWWGAIYGIPLVNIAALWIFAFAKWPIDRLLPPPPPHR